MKSRYAVSSDDQWELIAPLMPDFTGKMGRPFNGGGPREVDTGVKSLSRDLHHNFKITLKIKR